MCDSSKKKVNITSQWSKCMNILDKFEEASNIFKKKGSTESNLFAYWFLTPELRRLLCNAIIQTHFDYACSAWYPNLTQKLKKKLQVMQNKCIRFCLQLDKVPTISHKEFKDLNCYQPLIGFKNVLFQSCLNLSMAIVRTT